MSHHDQSELSYIYLVLLSFQNLIKIGKTSQNNFNFLYQYPSDTTVIIKSICYDCDNVKKELIQEFSQKYVHRRDIGNDYFQGNYIEMCKDIQNKIFP